MRKPRVKRPRVDRTEEAANRILEVFDLDVGSDLQFDAMCDAIDQWCSGRDVNRLCADLGNAYLPPKVTLAVIQTLLGRDLREVVPVPEAEVVSPVVPQEPEFFDLELKSRSGSEPPA